MEVGVTEMVVEVEALPLVVGDSVPDSEVDAQALTEAVSGAPMQGYGPTGQVAGQQYPVSGVPGGAAALQQLAA